MADLGQGTFLAFVLGGGLDFNFTIEKVVDGQLRKCMVEWRSETWMINWDMHGIRTGRGSNGSIRRTHSDIHVASDNFDFIVILVINNGLGFDGLASVLGLDVYVHNEKLKIKSGEDIKTRTFGLTSARAAATSAAPCFWASTASRMTWTFFRYSLTSLKTVGSVIPLLPLL